MRLVSVTKGVLQDGQGLRATKVEIVISLNQSLQPFRIQSYIFALILLFNSLIFAKDTHFFL